MNEKKLRQRIWIIYCGLYLIGAIIFRMVVQEYGKSLVHIYDAQDQYLPFLKYLNLYYRELIRNFIHGDYRFRMFDYSLGWGMDPIQTLSYYGIADPLCFPVIFFRQTNVLQYYYFLLQLRPFLAGAAFIGMCFHFDRVKTTVPFCALAYLSTGWALYAFSVHPFFMNFMILLPMMIIGVDRILQRRSPVLFVLSVFWCGCIGFYFLYMVSMCMFLFAVVRLACGAETILFPLSESDHKRDTEEPRKNRKENRFRLREGNSAGHSLRETGPAAVRITAICFGYWLTGVLMSLFILLPSLSAVMGSMRGVSSVLPENMLIYPIKELVRLFARTAFVNTTTASLGMGAVGIFCVIMALAGRRGKEVKVLTVVSALLWFIPFWSVLMSGFSMPNYRWFFALALLCAFLCTDIAEYTAGISNLQLIIFLMSAGAVTVASRSDYPRTVPFSVLQGIMIGVSLCLTIVSCRKCGKRTRLILCIGLLCVQCMTNVTAYFSPVWFDAIHLFSGEDVQKRIDESPVRLVRKVSDYDDTFRTENGFNNSLNTNAVLQIPSVRVYGSLIPESVSEFVVAAENNSMSAPYSIYGLDNRAALMGLCSVRYYLSSDKDLRDIPYGYKRVYEEGDVRVCRNQDVPGLGVVFYKTLKQPDVERWNGIEKQSLFLQGAMLEESGNSEKDVDVTGEGIVSDVPSVTADSLKTGVTAIPFSISDANGVSMSNGTLEVDPDMEEPYIDVHAQIPGNSEIYLRLEDFETSDRLNFYIEREDGKKVKLIGRDRIWAHGQKDFSTLLECTQEDGDRDAHYRITFSHAGKCRLGKIELWAYDLKQYEENVHRLSENSMRNVRFDMNTISGTIEPVQTGILCLSVPYSSGWSVYVDGVKQKCLRANYLCTAVAVPKGKHEVVFRYRTPGLIPGILLSLAGCLIFILEYRYWSHTRYLRSTRRPE